MHKKFLFTTDLHYGWERVGGHKKAIHDIKAWSAVIKFAQDFKPDIWIVGGDFLDCSCISHHTKHKPGQTEGMRLIDDATEGRDVFIEPIEEIARKKVYITANHEKWLEDFTDEYPQLEGILDLKTLLGLDDWEVIPQGGMYNLGKLTFMHGDTLSGGENVAKAAVINYERNVRFGHYHTYSTYAKTSPVDYKNGKTGIAVPCLCTKSPKYGKGKPNRWMQGFNFGYVGEGGNYNDYVAIIVDGKFIAPDGKVYKG